MSMNTIVIKNIYRDILEISDIQRQKSYWLGGDKENTSSYVEVMCRLFDDSDFVNFIDNQSFEIGLSKALISQLKILKKMLMAYQEKKTDTDIIQDPEWLKVVDEAKVVIEYWQKERTIDML